MLKKQDKFNIYYKPNDIYRKLHVIISFNHGKKNKTPRILWIC